MKQAITRGKSTKPNPKALAELQARFLYWLAKREIQKRARAHWIGQRWPPTLNV